MSELNGLERSVAPLVAPPRQARAAARWFAGHELAPGRPYPERREAEPGAGDRFAARLWHHCVSPVVGAAVVRRTRARRFIRRVDAAAAHCAALDDAALARYAFSLVPTLRRDGFRVAAGACLFAAIREAGARTMGMRHYDTQLVTAWWLLQGMLVEMATGEGKSYAAALAATSAAMVGLPVHVITVNDYLAARDAAHFAPLYAFFGLRSAAVANGLEPAARTAAYTADITYASNSEVAFDYLRDRAALGDSASPMHLAVRAVRGAVGAAPPRVVLRGLVFAIVDEADSVFIDEARTPLLLARTRDDQPQAPVVTALEMASQMHAPSDYVIDADHHCVRMTRTGLERLEQLNAGDAAAFPSLRSAHEWVERALAALHLYKCDEHYVIADGKIHIVDESTGRAMPDRSWERGLHQLIECKEGLALTGARETMARITYQRFFRRYLKLAGMSGTATEVASEIGITYGLSVARVPLHRPCRRRDRGAQCFADADARWAAVVEAVQREAVQNGRPVLVGTRTVKASERLSACLRERGIAHVVLNARHDREEQDIVARAGESGRVTVATNMAGRGTDIALGEGVAERGGLHVVLTEYHESRRIDRQLFGRSARQGDPGTVEALVALDDELFTREVPRLSAWLARRAGGVGRVARPWLALLRYLAQGHAEARNRDQREAALEQDR
ncbi:MAG: hypothetical protein RKL32_21030, partial [Gammaproteobacteria bacterium]